MSDVKEPSKARRWIVLFLAAAVGGALCDNLFHVQLGVLYYPHAVFFGQDWWVAPFFGTVGVIAVAAMGPLVRFFGDRERPSHASVILPSVLFIAIYFATGLFHESPRALMVGLVLFWGARMALRLHQPTLILSLLSAAAGPLVEVALSAAGGFRYHHPNLANITVWLPGLYLHLGPLLRQIYLAYFAAPPAPLRVPTAAATANTSPPTRRPRPARESD